MATETGTNPAFFTGQRRLFAGIFVALCLALAGGYYLFLRTDYAVLYTDMKPADASAIVAELDAKGISHRLRDNGTTILVPTDQTDNVRLAVAGSDIPMKGSVGFELFNKSDMGLTDFAQKINYQRALQGEIARSIMMMDGVETARVHLAMPEHSLYRANQSTPKAAVEVIPKLGRPLTPDRVAGIQQLVAAAVPELSLAAVVVIDGDGRVISQAPASQAIQTPEIEEQTAAQNYYGARAKAALAKAMPGMQFGVRALLLPITEPIQAAPALPVGNDGAAKLVDAGKSEGGGHNFQLRLTVLTLTAMSAEDQAIARGAVAAAVGLDEEHGDNLVFEVGPIVTPAPAPAILPSGIVSNIGEATPADSPAAVPIALNGISLWWVLALVGLAAVLGIMVAVNRREPAMAAAERKAFVDRIRQQLGTASGDNARV